MIAGSERLFLVIGAMKSGTTTLYHDLALLDGMGSHPTKEPGLFADRRTDAAVGRDLVRFLAQTAGRVGDFSTNYTMARSYPGVPARAHRILGGDVSIVYLVRDPIRRAVAHHHHWLARGRTVSDVDRALREDPAFVDVSSYGTQLRLWEEEFGQSHVKVVVFEHYVRNRAAVVNDIAATLGLRALRMPVGDAVFNADAGGRVARGLAGRIVTSRPYQLLGRRLLPPPLRQRVAARMLRDAGARMYPSDTTLAWLRDRLEPDLRAFVSMLQWERPPWDLDETITELSGNRER